MYYLKGKVFHRLTVIDEKTFTNKRNKILVRCECGTVKTVSLAELTRAKNGLKSCGCLKNELASKRRKTHGKTGTDIYKIWKSIKGRCRSKNKDYGGRGIKVCDLWSNSFEAFYDWAKSGYKQGLEIDRINNDGNYEPNNCRWVSRKVNANNKRNNVRHLIGNDSLTIGEISDKYGISYGVIKNRIKYGYTGKDIVNTENLNFKYVNYLGKREKIIELAKRYNIPIKNLRDRLLKGWDIDRALKQPVRGRRG